MIAQENPAQGSDTSWGASVGTTTGEPVGFLLGKLLGDDVGVFVTVTGALLGIEEIVG